MFMSLKGVLFGEECEKCAAFGIKCTQAGILSGDQNNPVGKSVIHSGGRGFVCQEPINQCPVVLGEVDSQQMAKELNLVVENIKGYVVQPEIKRRPSKTVIVFKF